MLECLYKNVYMFNKRFLYFGLILILFGVLFSFYDFWQKKETKEADEELKKQIGQMLVVGFRGTEAEENSYLEKAIKELNLGGLILFDYDLPSKSFPRNILNPEQTKNLIKNLKSFSSTPLLIAVDAEGGLINRLKEKYGFISVPSHQQLGEKDDVNETKKISSELAKELFELGFNVNFAPVIDLNINPENPIIGGLERSFSDDPQKVVNQAQAFIEGQHQYDIITSIKHFPGHGSSKQDSHKGMADVTETYQEEEIIPYQELIKNKVVDMVMTAHIVNKKIDPEYPATLSPFFIKEILREQLKFEGVVVSDDMQMAAIADNYGFGEALIKAINAGCDILIISNNNEIYDESAPYKARDIIFEAVKNGKISSERINQSFNRISKLKINLK